MDLSHLNPQQQEAVRHKDGPLMVVAGAGTGKTAVITHRIAHLITHYKVEPQQILALTFTEKAAGEMLDRLDSLVGWQAYQVNVMTFHAFGRQLLSQYGHHIGQLRTELIPDITKVVLMQRHISEIDLEYFGPQRDQIEFLQSIIEYIQALQNADVTAESYREYLEDLKSNGQSHRLDIAEVEDRLKLYQLYEKVKKQYGVVDFNDQIGLSLQILQQKPNIAARLRQQFKYVLVDEYQDTNGPQDALLRAFIPQDGNICVVGDDDQAIYGFRGAKISNILNFGEHFRLKKTITLTQNYRSTQQILDAAYRMIQNNNPDRLEVKLGLDKHLRSSVKGSEPRFHGYQSKLDEFEGVAKDIVAKIDDGTAADLIAVLATSHASLHSLARVLRQNHIGYWLSSTINIFEQTEILQLWHLARWIGMVAEPDAILHVLRGPLIAWSDERVRHLVEESKAQAVSYEEVLQRQAQDDAAARSLVDRLSTWRSWTAVANISQVLYRLVFETGLSQRWIAAAENSPRMVRVFEDLQHWLRHAQQFELAALDSSLGGYLATFPKPPEIEAGEITGDDNGVALLTIHASKGLEFDTVFIINNTHDAWADRSLSRVSIPEELQAVDEEFPPEHERRRLLYVAMTRAKSELIMSASLQQADGRNRKISQFVSEIFGVKPVEKFQPSSVSGLKNVMQELQRFAPKPADAANLKLPFASSDGWLELSVTDLDKYLYCPYEFYLEKVLRIISPAGPQIQFGSIMHNLFHNYYQSRQVGEPLLLAGLQQQLQQQWSVQGYSNQVEAENDLKKAQKTLEQFYAREETIPRKLRSTEESFGLVIPEAKLRIKGKIDVSFEDHDGIEVRDFKTGLKRDPEKLAQNARDSLQLRTYALAIEQITGKAPTRVVLDYVVTGVEGVASLTPLLLKNHRRKLNDIADNIRAQKFQPRHDIYHVCAATKYWGSSEDDL
jgi:DNA helicase-2/ATP-dependent DNA helicase PcrA